MVDRGQVSNAAWPSYCSRMCATSPCARVDERADALHSTSLAQVLCLLLSFSIDDRAELLLHRRSSLLRLSWPWRCTFPSQARRSFLCSLLLHRPAIVPGRGCRCCHDRAAAACSRWDQSQAWTGLATARPGSPLLPLAAPPPGPSPPPRALPAVQLPPEHHRRESSRLSTFSVNPDQGPRAQNSTKVKGLSAHRQTHVNSAVRTDLW
jgi:hypothetical protein